MTFYRSSSSDSIVRDEIRTNIGQPNQSAATDPSTTDRGLIGLIKGQWTSLISVLQAVQDCASSLRSIRRSDEGVFWVQSSVISNSVSPIFTTTKIDQTINLSQSITVNQTNVLFYFWGTNWINQTNIERVSFALRKTNTTTAIALRFVVEWDINGMAALQDVLTVSDASQPFIIPVQVSAMSNRFRLAVMRTSGSAEAFTSATGLIRLR